MMRMAIEKIIVRVSHRGVPHTLVTIDGVTYSIGYFSKRQGPMYRVWVWEPNRQPGEDQVKVCDIAMEHGQEVDIEAEIKKYL